MRKSRGFTLVEIVVVMVIFGIVLTMAAAVTRGIIASQQRTVTTTRLSTVDLAIAQFVAVQKRMPCPADGTLASTANNAGVEVAPDVNGCSSQTNGVVPWVTLGLTETDATDGWNHRFTYRTGQSLGLTMDMSQCDPAGAAAANAGTCVTGCASATVAACTAPQNFLLNKGLAVQNVAGTTVMNPAAVPATGAAYVVISAGQTGGGAYLNSGALGPTTTTDGNQEQLNYASLPLRAYYVDDSISDTAGATHFDDIVSRPSVMTVINKASLGPRSH
jgi:prepilin-type N-terminal cleavage/methylation domain-containing protein